MIGQPDGSLAPDDVEALRKEFAADPAHRRAQNAVTRTTIDDLTLDREIVTGTDHSMSITLDDWKVTNQRKSGRCWLFAGLNLLRPGAMEALGLKDFEFSQNHLMFWDKFERANYFLEAVVETSARDVDDRTVAYLLAGVAGDGGQWNMFVALVHKHGLVPRTAMPETESSSNTRRMNSALQSALRHGAGRIRAATDPVAMRAVKSEVLSTVWRILAIHLGTPPERFDWQWTDSDKVFHRAGELTPAEFAQRYVTLPLDEYVCLVDDPRPSSPRGTTFTVQYLGNVVGGAPVTYLNAGADVLRDCTRRTLERGEPVWFGCDVSQMMHRELGIWDARLYDLESVYGSPFGPHERLDKAERLTYHESQMTHAMLFTGVDVVDRAPRRWRVENSWGDEGGVKGFYTMNDSWFGEHVFEVAVRRDLLPDDLRAALDRDPIMLPAWDPMGALAR